MNEETANNSSKLDLEYISEMSNSKLGILVEICLYSKDHKTNWLLNKMAKSTYELYKKNSPYANWVLVGPNVVEQLDNALKDLDKKEHEDK